MLICILFSLLFTAVLLGGVTAILVQLHGWPETRRRYAALLHRIGIRRRDPFGFGTRQSNRALRNSMIRHPPHVGTFSRFLIAIGVRGNVVVARRAAAVALVAAVLVVGGFWASSSAKKLDKATYNAACEPAMIAPGDAFRLTVGHVHAIDGLHQIESVVGGFVPTEEQARLGVEPKMDQIFAQNTPTQAWGDQISSDYAGNVRTAVRVRLRAPDVPDLMGEGIRIRIETRSRPKSWWKFRLGATHLKPESSGSLRRFPICVKHG